MKAPVTAPIAGAQKSELAATVAGETGPEVLTREQFGALKVAWKTFAKQAQTNADERHEEKADRVEEKFFDDNPNNNNGAIQAHFNTHNGKGVDYTIC